MATTILNIYWIPRMPATVWNVLHACSQSSWRPRRKATTSAPSSPLKKQSLVNFGNLYKVIQLAMIELAPQAGKVCLQGLCSSPLCHLVPQNGSYSCAPTSPEVPRMQTTNLPLLLPPLFFQEPCQMCLKKGFSPQFLKPHHDPPPFNRC